MLCMCMYNKSLGTGWLDEYPHVYLFIPLGFRGLEELAERSFSQRNVKNRLARFETPEPGQMLSLLDRENDFVFFSIIRWLFSLLAAPPGGYESPVYSAYCSRQLWRTRRWSHSAVGEDMSTMSLFIRLAQNRSNKRMTIFPRTRRLDPNGMGMD